jgi:hypothetical protein
MVNTSPKIETLKRPSLDVFYQLENRVSKLDPNGPNTKLILKRVLEAAKIDGQNIYLNKESVLDILQQTRIQQGLPYFLKFVDKFPQIQDLANASETARVPRLSTFLSTTAIGLSIEIFTEGIT